MIERISERSTEPSFTTASAVAVSAAACQSDINGNGFFVTSNNGEIGYTRAGYFGTDREGYMVNNFGNRLQGYTVDANGDTGQCRRKPAELLGI